MHFIIFWEVSLRFPIILTEVIKGQKINRATVPSLHMYTHTHTHASRRLCFVCGQIVFTVGVAFHFQSYQQWGNTGASGMHDAGKISPGSVRTNHSSLPSSAVPKDHVPGAQAGLPVGSRQHDWAKLAHGYPNASMAVSLTGMDRILFLCLCGRSSVSGPTEGWPGSGTSAPSQGKWRLRLCVQ